MNKQCEARRQCDQMRCEKCDLLWDLNDPEPPTCSPTIKKIGDDKNFIDNFDYLNPMINIEVGDVLHRFSVRDIPPERQEWFLNTIHNHFQAIHRKAKHDAIQEMRTDLKKLLGIES